MDKTLLSLPIFFRKSTHLIRPMAGFWVPEKPLHSVPWQNRLLQKTCAWVKMEPEELEPIVRDMLELLSKAFSIEMDIIDLQCFSPAYPTPPYLIREGADS